MVHRAGEIDVDTKRRTVGPLVGISNDMREIAVEIRNIGLDLTALEETPPGSGTTVRDGSGAPSNGLGANGDYYLDDDTGDWYKRAGGTYSRVYENVGGGGGGASLIVGAFRAGLLEARGTEFSDAVDVANGDVTFSAAGFPFLLAARQLIVRVSASIVVLNGGTITLVGVSSQGEAINEVISLSYSDPEGIMKDFGEPGGGFVTAQAFAALTSATIANPTSLTGTPDQNQITIMYGPGLGLPCPVGVTDFEVFASSMDGATPGTVGATTGIIAPTTDFDGSSDFTFYFRYTAPSA